MTNARSTLLVASLSLLPAMLFAQPPARPIDAAPRTVTLSLAEYNRLLDLSAAVPSTPAQASPGAAINAADLRVRVDGPAARGQFVLQGAVFNDGVQTLPLITGANVLGATANGRVLPLVVEGQTHAALLQGVGPFTATLEWGASLAFQPGRASFTLPVPHSGTARATLDLPGDQADVRISTGLITRKAPANGRTLVDVTLKPGTPAEVSWTMRDSAPVAAARDTRTVADVFTLVTIGESDIRMAALLDVTVVQGEPRTFEARIPAGYEISTITGSSLDRTDERPGSVVLTGSDTALRRHQVLVSLERAHEPGSFSFDTAMVQLPAAQRERGEIAVEGLGTLDLTAAEREGLHRIDVRELNSVLQQMARTPLLSAFRYQRAADTPQLALQVKRFQDAGVLAAVASSATVTTMVTAEGRALTEIALVVQNRAQPFLKVTLPEGATLASVEVAGETAKPVIGADGIRVPLLRPNFRPEAPYSVSFVYMHAGTPFAKKGDLPMTLPRMDIPIGLLQWELFVPERYNAKVIDGNVIDGKLYAGLPAPRAADRRPAGTVLTVLPYVAGFPGQIRGTVTDTSGARLPGVTIQISMRELVETVRTVVTDGNGAYLLNNIPSGSARITASLAGFQTVTAEFLYDQQPRQRNFELAVGSLEETITVSSASPALDVCCDAPPERPQPPKYDAPSSNVLQLQRRVAGVLPIRVDVPRAGTSHQFVRALVIDDETQVTLRYKRR